MLLEYSVMLLKMSILSCYFCVLDVKMVLFLMC